MFHNYFFLKRLTAVLNDRLVGLTLLTCFSQNKDELIMGFGDETNEFWIRANLDPNVSLLSFPNVFHRAGKNSIDLFTELLDKKVVSVSVFNYERSFQISFEDGHSLIFKLHARRSNILLVKDGLVSDIFRKALKQDLEIEPSSLNKDLTITEEAFKDVYHDPSQLIPALGKEFQRYWETHCIDLEDEEKWNNLQKLLEILEKRPIQLIADGKPRLSLLEEGTEQTDDPVYASNWLYDQTTRTYYLQSEKTALINQLKHKIRQSENYIFKTGEKLRLVESQRSPDEIANIIMANLGLIQTGLDIVTLSDIYRSGLIEIKLNPKLSPQKNAENYYRKSKNRHQEIENLNSNIREKERLIDELSAQVLEVEAIEDHKSLRKYQKAHKTEKTAENRQVAKNYHEVFVDGWQILIGKNAKANDELTLKVAKKDDLWLHAKDVSGSHVVIKQIPGQNYPNHIIETAAAYAAYYSKRKTETLCPVIYTPKKFVRKVKGTPFGQVLVEKEQIVLIKPEEPVF